MWGLLHSCRSPDKRLLQFYGPWGLGEARGEREGLRVEKYWVLSHNEEKCLGSLETLAEIPEKDLDPRPKIKRSRNEYTGARYLNMRRAWPARGA